MDKAAQEALCRASFSPNVNPEVLITSRILGNGSFGSVVVGYRAMRDGLFESIAIKQIHLKDSASVSDALQCVADLVHEVGCHEKFADSPHVLPLKGTCWFCPRRSIISIPMALCSGALDDYARGINYKYPAGVLFSVFQQCLRALHAIHAKGLVHRDVKPQNILIQSGRTPQDAPLLFLADFGLAQSARELRHPHRAAGTISFMPLEAFSSVGQAHPHAQDVWALACTFFFLLTGRLPFRDSSTLDMLRSIRLGVREIETKVLGSTLSASEEVTMLIPLVFSMFELDPGHRPTATQLLQRLEEGLDSLSPEAVTAVRRQQRYVEQLQANSADGAGSPRYTRMVVCRPNHAVPVYNTTDVHAPNSFTGISVQPGRDVLVDLAGRLIPACPVTAPLRPPFTASISRYPLPPSTGPLMSTMSRQASPSPLHCSAEPPLAWAKVVFPVRGFVVWQTCGQHLMHKVDGISPAVLCPSLAPPRTVSPRTLTSPFNGSLSVSGSPFAQAPLRTSSFALPLASSLSVRFPVLCSNTPLQQPLNTNSGSHRDDVVSPTARRPVAEARQEKPRKRSTLMRLFSRSHSVG